MQILLIAVGWLIFVYIHAFLVYVNIFVEDRSKKVSWTPTSIMLLAYFNYICRMPKNVVLFTAQGRKFGCWGKGPGVKPPPRVELLVTWNSTGWRCEKRSLELVDFFWLKVLRGNMWQVFEYDLLLQMTKLVSMSFGSTWAKAVVRGMNTERQSNLPNLCIKK